MVMTPALVNFSPWLRICSWLELRGKGMVSYVPQMREEQMVRIFGYACMYNYVCVAPPMIVGAWSMAIVLWQLYEYYYYYIHNAFPQFPYQNLTPQLLSCDWIQIDLVYAHEVFFLNAIKSFIRSGALCMDNKF